MMLKAVIGGGAMPNVKKKLRLRELLEQLPERLLNENYIEAKEGVHFGQKTYLFMDEYWQEFFCLLTGNRSIEAPIQKEKLTAINMLVNGRFRIFSTDELSSEINRLVKSEKKTNPLTDEQMTVRINKRGFNVSVYTIGKIRRRLGIESSRTRRVEQ